MTGLVASGTTTNVAIENDGWFPDISSADLRAAERVGGSVSDERLIQAVVAAVLSVNAALEEWKAVQVALGYGALAAVPASTIKGSSRLIALYFRAVYSLAHADLIERFTDYDTTNSGSKRAEEVLNAVAEQHRNARWAIRDLQGLMRNTVELI